MSDAQQMQQMNYSRDFKMFNPKVIKKILEKGVSPGI